MKTKIFNLTAHFCPHPEVEDEPRIHIISDLKDYTTIVKQLKEVATEIPRFSSVLIGGHTQIVGLLLQIAKIKQWQVYYYSSYDNSIYSATFLSRMDRLEIERCK